MSAITLETARLLVERAMDLAQRDFGRPVCVAVCDPQGFLVAFGRMEGAPVRSIAISQGKAYSAARMGVGTEAFLARIQKEQIDVGYFCDPLLTALPGGSVLKDAGGRVVGAVGVSGLTSAQDQQVTDRVAELLRPGAEP
ncbi:MAG TPA: heme-binding protein [Burkholderiales bacterium]|jgi:uncharacterized protein GlcG (DUF336 family)|nr:heme-binding protein [Burkholderiales bacterium]